MQNQPDRCPICEHDIQLKEYVAVAEQFKRRFMCTHCGQEGYIVVTSGGFDIELIPKRHFSTDTIKGFV